MKTMKFIGIYIWTGLCLLSCSDNDFPAVDQDNSVTPLAIQWDTNGMWETNAASTRSVTESVEMEMGGGASTRADVKNSAEASVKNVWFLLFDGKEGSSKLVAKLYTTTPNKISDSDFLKAIQVGYRLHAVANTSSDTAMDGLTIGTSTIADLPAMEITGLGLLTTGEISSKGLLMTGYADLTPGSPTISLTSRMAKVTFTYNLSKGTIDNYPMYYIYLGNIANKVAIQSPINATGNRIYKYRICDNYYHSSYTFTCYIPENLAGNKTSITSVTGRNYTDSPANASFVFFGIYNYEEKVPGYYFYLGNGIDAPSDFNVNGNHWYNLSVTIKGVNNATDSRIVEGKEYIGIPIAGYLPTPGIPNFPGIGNAADGNTNL